MELPRRNRWPEIEPPELIEDVTRGDLVEALQHLPLRRSDATCLVRLDRGVRDFIVMALRGR
jgi:hypothetical protein